MTVPELLEAPPAGRSGPSAIRRTSLGPLTASATVVLGLMVVGGAVRFIAAHQSMFADELSTYWIVATHGLGGVMSLLNGTYPGIQHAEISPPLFFVASWLTSQLGHAPELIRAPSLVAGILTIPAVYALGLSTVGRTAAVLGATFTTLSPFMIYYSAEARSYAVLMLLTTLSTLAMLRAAETRRARWWVAYALLSCAAFYTHYTCVFYLAAQFLWLAWVHREALRPAVLATFGAALGVVPWAHGLINDLNSPTEGILSALSPFTFDSVRHTLEHWTVGYPYVEAGGLARLPGTPALVLLGLAVVICAVGIGTRVVRERKGDQRVRVADRATLIALLAVSVPVGEAVVSAVSTQLFGVRNLAASWPALALSCAAAVLAAGARLRYAAAVLVVASFVLGASKMLTVHFARPDFRAAADYIDRNARSGDVVIDTTAVLSPGPLSGLDVVLHRRVPVVRAFARAEREHPFGLFDPVTSPAEAITRATASSTGRRLIVVAFPNLAAVLARALPAGYRRLETRLYPEFIPLRLEIWAGPPR
ncbi:MAG: glycosyltransferase family 39 protein [Actinomycetota bacterium]|nr:glycosyltransferase family 39 protein [Actinomycetota bacterium]